MKALYVTSLHTFSGKTALCLGLGLRFQAEGYGVGYFKPLSTHPWPVTCGMTDEDADFVRRVLHLVENPCDLVSVVLNQDLLMQELTGESPEDLLAKVKGDFERVAVGKDVMLLEGGASLREGFSVGLGTPVVAQALDAPVLAVTPYLDRMSFLDDCLVADLRLGDRLVGMVANKVPGEEMDFVTGVAGPYLEQRGIPLLGALPNREQLQAISVVELVDVLQGEFLCLPDKGDVLIERMIVGAMSVEQALPRIRRVSGAKAVITGGDRADMQLVALETATKCLVLTGHLRPVPEVLRRAEEAGVPVILVRGSTMETVEAIEDVFGKTRLGQAAKLDQFESLLTEHFDFKRLCEALGLQCPSA
ncbi:MAG: phosphotransacetylase family protein [Anaerolineae bacterium]|nr:phosphotransacetylase family protein [Anaerolineae bacterium]